MPLINLTYRLVGECPECSKELLFEDCIYSGDDVKCGHCGVVSLADEIGHPLRTNYNPDDPQPFESEQIVRV